MKLTYIYHSGYVIEGDRFTILIDYFKDTDGKVGIVHDKILKNDGKLYILSTHSHHDHFNPEILKWRELRPDIVYVFSKDILDNKMARPEDAVYLDKLETYIDDTIYIKAFGSTDLGGSFLIKVGDKTIFHAGDLNNWHWNEESTKEEIEEAENNYLSELTLLAKEVKHIDLAMFPVDPRLGKDYMKGAEQFIDTIKTYIFAPMHFGEEYYKAFLFGQYAIRKGVRFAGWEYKGESINF